MVVSSQLLNRQDGEDEYHVRTAALGEGRDPRQARRFQHRVLLPRLQRRHDDPETGGEVLLGYQCANSGMTLACGYQHLLQTSSSHTIETTIGADLAKTVFTIDAVPGETVRIAKLVAYHSSTGVPAEELADRCHRTLARARSEGPDQIVAQQRAWLDEFWFNSDVEVRGDEPAQQAVRWNLFQLAQASARTQEQGIAAKGVTGGGYDGHYFWDTEVYVIPFLAYTSPDIARKLLRFRWRMLPAARRRAAELSQRRRAVPVAHHQRRGGVGVLRRGHRPVPHQRRGGVRVGALPQRHRRRRLPRRRGRRDDGRDGTPLGGPRLLRDGP